ncbi:MAG: CDP-diacylglycerol--serine O-phosphatidyltransferase [Schleiferiaceae bacterium]|jgi:CDP-diacylglycerol--serine O-phosphatidyltransferase|nr:CDP-diacylglycerol--serine O-phosphatidyltransferase [Schleiferiaceae bacterium]
MKRSIPNILTLSNLLCGLLAINLIFDDEINLALLFVVIGTVFDFFDGFAARMLKVQGELGKQLDSLADMVTFGVVPGFLLLHTANYSWANEHWLEGNPTTLLIGACCLLIPLFSALRLAKFNIDERQASGFIGLPTPANTLFIGSLVWLIYNNQAPSFLENEWVLAGIGLLSSLLLVAPIPLFALKFKNFTFKDNWIRYVFIAICLILVISFGVIAVPFIIIIYILMSVLDNKKQD